MNSKVRERGVTAVGFVAVFSVVLAAAWLMGRAPGEATDGLVAGGASTEAPARAASYTLPEGRTATDVGRDLEQLGVIRSARQFRVLVALMGLENKLSAGDYELPGNASTATIINLLTVKKSVPTLRVTFPEGTRIEEMAVLAEKAGFGSASDFLAATRIAQLPDDFQRAEFLLDHGLIDKVVDRKEMKETLARIIELLT